jgi:hypothetical protein
MLLDGLNSGDSIPADAAFWADPRKDALARLEPRKPESNKKRGPENKPDDRSARHRDAVDAIMKPAQFGIGFSA